jgi:hypothetical protein
VLGYDVTQDEPGVQSQTSPCTGQARADRGTRSPPAQPSSKNFLLTSPGDSLQARSLSSNFAMEFCPLKMNFHLGCLSCLEVTVCLGKIPRLSVKAWQRSCGVGLCLSPRGGGWSSRTASPAGRYPPPTNQTPSFEAEALRNLLRNLLRGRRLTNYQTQFI